MAVRTIVVGTDGSASADRAVGEAIDLASASSARLVIVTAFERHDGGPGDEVPDDVRWMATQATAAEKHAREARRRAHERGVDDVVVQALDGAPAEQLIETATDFDADVIVVGSVGLTNSAHFVLGSVAASVLHHAPCDVLVVRTD